MHNVTDNRQTQACRISATVPHVSIRSAKNTVESYYGAREHERKRLKITTSETRYPHRRWSSERKMNLIIVVCLSGYAKFSAYAKTVFIFVRTGPNAVWHCFRCCTIGLNAPIPPLLVINSVKARIKEEPTILTVVLQSCVRLSSVVCDVCNLLWLNGAP